MVAESRKIILKYGQTVIIKASSTSSPIETKAIIQPLRSDIQSSLYGDYTDSTKTEQFLYIGLPEIKLSTYPDTTIITCAGENYTINKSESFDCGNQVMYERAVLEKSST